MCKYLTILNIYKQTFNQNIKSKVFYFALEESATDFWLSFISYYLYEKEEGEFLSIISPGEWKGKFEYIGKFQFLSDGRWQQID